MRWPGLAAVVALYAGCAAAPSATAPPAVSIDPAARPILDAWARALAGHTQIAATPQHWTTTWSSQGEHGTSEHWSDPSGAFADVANDQGEERMTVFDGAHGWRRDHGGVVRELAGFELVDARTTAFFASGGALRADPRPCTVVTNLDGTLTITPAGGRETIVAFDPATHLPRTLTRRRDERVTTFELSDWRDVDGAKVSFAEVARDDQGGTMEARIDHMDHASRNGGYAAPIQTASVPLAAPVVLPFQKATGNWVKLAVELGGGSHVFLLDTGVSGIAIDTSLADELGLARHGSVAMISGGGAAKTSYIDHVALTVGGVELPPLRATTNEFRKTFRDPSDGALGYDLMARFVVELDFRNERVTLHDAATYRHQGPGAAIPITLERGVPWTDLVLETGAWPITGHFLIDTGCQCPLIITAPFAEAHHLVELLRPTRTTTRRGLGGESKLDHARLPGILLGDRRLRHTAALLSHDTKGAYARTDRAGAIGIDVLSSFLVTFDYGRGKMWLDPFPSAPAGADPWAQ